jgi:predicted GTPase
MTFGAVNSHSQHACSMILTFLQDYAAILKAAEAEADLVLWELADTNTYTVL